MIKVYFDGASAGDPGPSGAGIFIVRENGEVERHSIPLGLLSNHEAELQALLHSLKICLENSYSNISFLTDSQLIENAVAKRYIKNKKYEPLLKEALHYIDQLPLYFIKWIPSKENQTADQLARKAIQLNK